MVSRATYDRFVDHFGSVLASRSARGASLLKRVVAKITKSRCEIPLVGKRPRAHADEEKLLFVLVMLDLKLRRPRCRVLNELVALMVKARAPSFGNQSWAVVRALQEIATPDGAWVDSLGMLGLEDCEERHPECCALIRQRIKRVVYYEIFHFILGPWSRGLRRANSGPCWRAQTSSLW